MEIPLEKVPPLAYSFQSLSSRQGILVLRLLCLGAVLAALALVWYLGKDR